MFKEFKKFALKGNMLDMAVGIIIGGAFGTIVKSLVDDVLMPPLGLLLGGVDFGDKKLVLKEAVDGANAVTLNYGSFINAVIAFLIVAFALFMVIKAMNKLQAKEEAAPAAPPKSEVLLEEIRDLLKKQNA
ncbi:MAG: large-conductance mechanosensitive channel protein MscL [Planctomycetes bacterium]|nr:large-conductance mechanosensitive channel protein MscL [Planctomycetota bacterium]MCB9824885.1 large-conductance mechanosensitive channel protein MscL [Planctomycetota bacterium]MCB9830328.1 large-conductance mechanosensitive channel protein MscL [Planctomycetota bacterium]